MSDIEREAFEQAVRKEFPGDYSFDLSSRGDYCDDYPLTTMWWVWQAARQGQAERNKRKLIRLVVAIMPHCDIITTSKDNKHTEGIQT